jgi:hypothetical protein
MRLQSKHQWGMVAANVVNGMVRYQSAIAVKRVERRHRVVAISKRNWNNSEREALEWTGWKR